MTLLDTQADLEPTSFHLTTILDVFPHLQTRNPGAVFQQSHD